MNHQPLQTNSQTIKRQPPSQAMYSISEQLDNLRQKEIDLEKAKLDFYLKAEDQRHKNDIEGLKKEMNDKLNYLKQQNDEHLKFIEQQHMKETQNLMKLQEQDINKLKNEHQAEIDQYLWQIRQLEEDIKLKSKEHKERQQQLLFEQDQKLNKELYNLRENLKLEHDQRMKELKRQMKVHFKQLRDQQVKEICEKLNEEQFELVNQLRQQIKELEKENKNLQQQKQDLNSRNRRQEEAILNFQQELHEFKQKYKPKEVNEQDIQVNIILNNVEELNQKIQSQVQLTDCAIQTQIEIPELVTNMMNQIVVYQTPEKENVSSNLKYESQVQNYDLLKKEKLEEQNMEIQIRMQDQFNTIKFLIKTIKDEKHKYMQYQTKIENKVTNLLQMAFQQNKEIRKKLLLQEIKYLEARTLLNMLLVTKIQPEQ